MGEKDLRRSTRKSKKRAIDDDFVSWEELSRQHRHRPVSNDHLETPRPDVEDEKPNRSDTEQFFEDMFEEADRTLIDVPDSDDYDSDMEDWDAYDESNPDSDLEDLEEEEGGSMWPADDASGDGKTDLPKTTNNLSATTRQSGLAVKATRSGKITDFFSAPSREVGFPVNTGVGDDTGSFQLTDPSSTIGSSSGKQKSSEQTGGSGEAEDTENNPPKRATGRQPRWAKYSNLYDSLPDSYDVAKQAMEKVHVGPNPRDPRKRWMNIDVLGFGVKVNVEFHYISGTALLLLAMQVRGEDYQSLRDSLKDVELPLAAMINTRINTNYKKDHAYVDIKGAVTLGEKWGILELIRPVIDKLEAFKPERPRWVHCWCCGTRLNVGCYQGAPVIDHFFNRHGIEREENFLHCWDCSFVFTTPEEEALHKTMYH